VLERLLEDAIATGDLRPVNVPVVAEAMITVVLRFTDPELARSRGGDPARELAELVDVFLDGARPRAGTAGAAATVA
jgi:hypothetical protein